jgi:DNA modification methylase
MKILERMICGDCREILPTLEPESVQCCVTSPPYWGLRDYGTAEWEGGSVWCEHKPSQEWDGRNFIDKSGLKGGWENQVARSTNRWYENDGSCKCGARRIDSQLGLEATPQEYITKMVAVFREVWRVLRDDGTCWINLGDSYAGSSMSGGCKESSTLVGTHHEDRNGCRFNGNKRETGLKPKDLCMMPARLAMALQADGWYLRSEIVWHKPNPMPESVTDRPTKAHEMIYLLVKNGGKPLIWRARDTGEWSYEPDLSETIIQRNWKFGDPDPGGNWSKGFRQGQYCGNSAFDNSDNKARVILEKREKADEEIPRWKGFDYFYDAEAIREPAAEDRFKKRPNGWPYNPDNKLAEGGSGIKHNHSFAAACTELLDFRNKRTVWTIATQPYAEAHFATFPEEIPKLCILAGSKPGDTILDPFAGSGTVGKVALELGRKAILIELNPEYMRLARERTCVTPGFF